MNMQELMRMVADQVANGVIDAEAELFCAEADVPRNGYRPRTLKTCLGDLTLRVPKVRIGSFFPSGVIERHRRVDRALAAAVTETCAGGHDHPQGPVRRRGDGGPRASARTRSAPYAPAWTPTSRSSWAGR